MCCVKWSSVINLIYSGQGQQLFSYFLSFTKLTFSREKFHEIEIASNHLKVKETTDLVIRKNDKF